MKSINYKTLSAIAIGAAIFAGSVFNLSSNAGIDLKKADALYKKHCSKCHRNNGEGIKKVYPPIKNADYIKNSNTEELLRGMLFGRTGKVIVNGVTYNGVMTTEIDGNVGDEDIALILSYVYQNFNGIPTVVKATDVKKARKAGKLPAHK
jgi:mono/diheme cytochrome c family protein